MSKKERIVIVGVVFLFVGIAYWLSHMNRGVETTSTLEMTIQQLYTDKGAIVAQKPALESKKIEIVVKLGNLDMQILDIDKKLYKLLNPQSSGLIQAGQPQVLSGTATQELSSQLIE